MEDHLKAYERQIKKTHKFGNTPKFKGQMTTQLKQRLFVEVAGETFQKLGWDVLYEGDNAVEAKSRNAGGNWTEKITATFDYGKVHVESVSLGGGIWDMGRNSKRVRLFIHAFELTEKAYDEDALKNLEEAVDRKDNWDDYVIPDSLPAPKNRIKPQIAVPVIGGLIVGLLVGFSMALLRFNGIYIMGMFEVGVAVLIAFAFKYFIRIGNYTNLLALLYILGGTVLITYMASQYFMFYLSAGGGGHSISSFFEFIKLKLETGIRIDSIDIGWVGLVLSWALQIGLTYFIAYIKVGLSYNFYLADRIPYEVSEFVLYYFIKGKKEPQVRHELKKMGWVTIQSQIEAIQSVIGLQNINEIRRG